MFDFYSAFYGMGYLSKQDIHNEEQWGCITKEEYKFITGDEYATA